MTESVVGYAWLGIRACTRVGPACFSRKILEETRTVELSKDH